MMRNEIDQRCNQFQSHIDLLETRHPEMIRRTAVAALKARLFALQENSRSRFGSFFIQCQTKAAFGLLRFVPDLVISGYLPGRIGRRLVIDTLIVWSEQ